MSAFISHEIKKGRMKGHVSITTSKRRRGGGKGEEEWRGEGNV